MQSRTDTSQRLAPLFSDPQSSRSGDYPAEHLPFDASSPATADRLVEKPPREARGALQPVGSELEIVPMMLRVRAEPKKSVSWRTFWTMPQDNLKEVDEAEDDAKDRRERV